MARLRKPAPSAVAADADPSPTRRALIPYMAEYAQKFADDGNVRWLPYLMYFHPRDHRSPVVNTDRFGFRYSECGGHRYSVGDLDGIDRIRILAGSSTVFGIGASSDGKTLASQLTRYDQRGVPWVNFGGRSFNSAQELLLGLLYAHLLPAVEEIVVLSGFNNLGLARLPEAARGDHGAFFMCGQFFDALGGPDPGPGAGLAEVEAAPTPLAQQLSYAADLTGRHLALWRMLADRLGCGLTYVLQPLANWVRPEPSAEEAAIFRELDGAGGFTRAYGDILGPEVQARYAGLVARQAERSGVPFLDLTPLLAGWAAPGEWLFIDRIHFTDYGHELVSRRLIPVLTGEEGA
jgi:hypothetical protein